MVGNLGADVYSGPFLGAIVPPGDTGWCLGTSVALMTGSALGIKGAGAGVLLTPQDAHDGSPENDQA